MVFYFLCCFWLGYLTRPRFWNLDSLGAYGIWLSAEFCFFKSCSLFTSFHHWVFLGGLLIQFSSSYFIFIIYVVACWKKKIVLWSYISHQMVSTYPLAVPSSCVKEFLLLIFSLDYAIFHFKSRILFPLRNAPYSVVIEQEDLDMFFLVLCASFVLLINCVG